MISLLQACRCFALFFSVALAGCASLDKYSFETFGRPKQTLDNYNPEAGPARSDLLALQYADLVAQLLEGRSTGARLTREGSDSALVVGAALAAAQATLEISAETIAGIGLGTVILRELQGIFNARGRSEAFEDAAYLIRQAQSEYRQFNPNPSPDYLTANGAILVSRVNAALHATRKSLNGRLPGLLDLQQATQPMTREGARRTGSGTPQTMFPAAGDRGQAAAAQQEALNARTKAASALDTLRVQKAESDGEIAALKSRIVVLEAHHPVDTDFTNLLRQISTKAGADAAKKTSAFTSVLNAPGVKQAGVPATLEPDPNKMNEFFQHADDTQRQALFDAATQQLKSM